MRVLGTNTDGSSHGVFTDRPGVLTNDFFDNLLSMATEWRAVDEDDRMFEGRDRKTKELRWTATQTDLIFGSNSQLRGLAETYAGDAAEHRFVDAFVAAWAKVMDLDRFDVK
ncbi:MAG: catalase-peroxidase [Loktanella salsilacus]|jgi:catalase-peroxidase